MVKALERKKLQNEYELLFLNYHRNKNQHKSTTWFKYLNILVRHLRKLLLSKSEKFQAKSISHLTSHVVPKLYWAFNGVIAQGQFISLGFSLVGSLSKISSILSELEPVKSVARDVIVPQAVAGRSTDQDIGEEITLAEFESYKRVKSTVIEKTEVQVEKLKRKSHDKAEKKKSKKRKKSAIDDIFG